MAARSLNIHITLFRQPKAGSQPSPIGFCRCDAAKSSTSLSQRIIICSALQESSTATGTRLYWLLLFLHWLSLLIAGVLLFLLVSNKKELEPASPKAAAEEAVEPAKREAPAKPKKAPVKPLPQMMEEDVIPSLRATLEAREDISQIELSFQDNRLEGSFLKKDNPYYFWAFFPDGVLTGPKGFSLSSYGTGASTVEPFLIDERKITDKHVVFWVRKRLAAQGILPSWKEE